MIVYRISRSIYANDLSGIGAGMFGGRWNPKGINLVYAASSISLACMEYLVHNIHIMKSAEISLSKIEIPDSASTQVLDNNSLPFDWNEKTYLPASTQEIGKQFFISSKSYLLKVPSAIITDEYNYLLNPLHPLHKETIIVEQIDPFEFDARLFG